MKIAVVGGGPSGCLAAIEASRYGEVTLFERNEKIGKKLFLTGKGRCNLTNAIDISEFFPQIITNKNFLYSALYSFSNIQLMDFFSKNVPLKIERGNRVFPKSDKSSDICNFLLKECLKREVRIKYNSYVEKVLKEGELFIVKTKEGQFTFDRLILATGGNSYKSTGSDGSGYKLASRLGHETVKPKGALVPIELGIDGVEKLAGLSLKNIELIAEIQGEREIKIFGELLFTHFGISGPIALTMSSYINRKENVELFLDLKPSLEHSILSKSLVRTFEEAGNKKIKTILKKRVPTSLVPFILKEAEVNGEMPTNQLSKLKRRDIVDVLKKFPLYFKNLFDANAAIITSGGVNVNEINPSTMESLLVSGLYFCGELLDVDALTGGYNLQIAFSTGYLAGNSI